MCLFLSPVSLVVSTSESNKGIYWVDMNHFVWLIIIIFFVFYTCSTL